MVFRQTNCYTVKTRYLTFELLVIHKSMDTESAREYNNYAVEWNERFRNICVAKPITGPFETQSSTRVVKHFISTDMTERQKVKTTCQLVKPYANLSQEASLTQSDDELSRSELATLLRKAGRNVLKSI